MATNYIDLPAFGDVHWKAPVVLTSQLPLLGNSLGDMRLAEDTNTLYVWGGVSWIAVATPGAAIAIDGLIGDGTATGPGVVPFTLTATSNTTLTSLAAGLTLLDTNADSPTDKEMLILSRINGNAGAGTNNRGAAITFHDQNNPTYTGAIESYRSNPNSDFLGYMKFFVNATGGAVTTFTNLSLALTLDTSANTIVANSLGIAVTPAANVLLDVVANTASATQVEQLTGYGANNIGIRIRHARGTSGTPTALQSGDPLGFFGCRGYGTSQFATVNTGSMQFVAIENFTNTANGTSLVLNTTPAGSTTLAEAARVASTGVTLGPQSNSTAIHQINGGLFRTTKTIAATYTVDTTTTDDIILCNAAGVINVTLPAPATGRTLTIKDISGNATANNISILRHASENIEGVSASYLIQVSYGTVILTADGTNWWIIG